MENYGEMQKLETERNDLRDKDSKSFLGGAVAGMASGLLSLYVVPELIYFAQTGNYHLEGLRDMAFQGALTLEAGLLGIGGLFFRDSFRYSKEHKKVEKELNEERSLYCLRLAEKAPRRYKELLNFAAELFRRY